MPDEPFDPWASAAADGTSAAVMKSAKKKDAWGSFKAGEAEALSDSEAAKPKQGKKKKGGDSKKPAGPSGPNLARKRVTDSKVSGVVESWTNSYGWIRPFQRVNHPKAGKHGGKIYIHGKDVKGGLGFLPVGAPVEFYVFEDDAGLGAEECSTDGKGKGGKGKGLPKGKSESSGKDRKGPKGDRKGEGKGSSYSDAKEGASEIPEVRTDWSGYTGVLPGASQGFASAKGSQAHAENSRPAVTGAPPPPPPGGPMPPKQVGASPMMPGGTSVPAVWPEARPGGRCPAPFMMSGIGTAPVPGINSVAVNQIAYPQYSTMMPGMSPPMPQPLAMNAPGALPGMYPGHVPPNPLQSPYPGLGGAGYEDAGRW